MRGRQILDAYFLAPESYLEIETLQMKDFILPFPFLTLFFVATFYLLIFFPTSQAKFSISMTLQSYATSSATLWVVPEMSLPPYLAKKKMDEMVSAKILDRDR